MSLAEPVSTDILIIGGGMVGASLALGLRQSPWRVALVDPRQPDPAALPPVTSAEDFSARVSALSPHSQGWLTRLGVWPTLPADRLSPYTHMQVWDAEGSGELVFDPQGADLHRLGHIVENRVVEQGLWTALEQWPDLTLLSGCRVAAIEQAEPASQVDAGPRWRIQLEDGREASTRLLLIADGARSPTRAMLGFQTRDWSYRQTAIVATVEHDLPHGQTARQAFHRAGPLAFLPLAMPHASSIVWSLDDAAATSFLAADAATQTRRLAAGLGHRLGAVRLVGRVHHFPLQQRHAVHYIRAGAALVGDAAHSIHPLAGQGANLGLRDAAALADILQSAATQGLPLEEPLLLRRYQRTRQSENLETMAAMEGLKRLFGSPRADLHLLRNLGLRWFNRQPQLMRAAIRRAAGL